MNITAADVAKLRKATGAGTELKISVTSSTNALGEDALFYCYCGWCDTGDQLLTEHQYKIKQRKDKLLKIKNYEN